MKANQTHKRKLYIAQIGALHTFEAAARHGSYSRAAEELFITQAAVSQQIRGLEQSLGVKLFVREGRNMRLTERGTRLLPWVSQGMAAFEQGMAALECEPLAGVLNVTVIPSFASRWLMPRLWRFVERHPEVEVRLNANPQVQPIGRGGMDLAIRYCNRADPEMSSCLLIRECVFPVCSPALAERLQRIEDLYDTVIVSGPDYAGVSWEKWLQESGYRLDLSRIKRFEVNNNSLAIDMVLSGKGVALSRNVLAGDLIASGLLTRLFTRSYHPDNDYHLIWDPDSPRLTRIRCFTDWLKEEVAQGPGCQPDIQAEP